MSQKIENVKIIEWIKKMELIIKKKMKQMNFYTFLKVYLSRMYRMCIQKNIVTNKIQADRTVCTYDKT